MVRHGKQTNTPRRMVAARRPQGRLAGNSAWRNGCDGVKVAQGSRSAYRNLSPRDRAHHWRACSRRCVEITATAALPLARRNCRLMCYPHVRRLFLFCHIGTIRPASVTRKSERQISTAARLSRQPPPANKCATFVKGGGKSLRQHAKANQHLIHAQR